jgi:hypothetical protein
LRVARARAPSIPRALSRRVSWRLRAFSNDQRFSRRWLQNDAHLEFGRKRLQRGFKSMTYGACSILE